MNYTIPTLQEDISVIDKLYGLLENALIDYEYQTLLESETLALPEKGTKEKKGRTFKTVLTTILTKLKNLFIKIGNTLSSMMKNIIGSQVYYVAKTDIQVGPYTRDKFPESICNKVLSIKNNTNDSDAESLEDDLDKCVDEEDAKKITIMKGTKVDVAQCVRHLRTNNKYIKLIEKKSNSDNSDDPKVFRIYKKLVSFLMSVGKNLSGLISNCSLFKKPNPIRYDKVDINKKKAEISFDYGSRSISKADKMMRNYDRAHGIKNESVMLSEGLGRNEYIASIMLEAADLLKEDINNDNMEYDIDSLLTEAIEYDDSNNIVYLNEAVEDLKEINEIKNEIKDTKSLDDAKINKITTKVKNTVNNLLKWYYKIEPEKKFRALHTVLKGLDTIFSIASIYIGCFFGLRTTYTGLNYLDEKMTLKRISLSKAGLDIKAKNTPRSREFKKYAILTILTIAVTSISASIRRNANIKYNISDFDNNIHVIKSQINKIDTQIKNAGDDKKLVDQLNKLKSKYDSMIDQLINMKDSYGNLGKKGL